MPTESVPPPGPSPGHLHIHLEPLPYEARLETRRAGQIDLVVIHCTELPDLAMAREYGEQVLYPGSGTGNSGHFYIDRDGSAHQYVDTGRVANHTRGYNPRSIGIELVNTGRYPHWLDSGHQAMNEAYPIAQIDTLVDLLRQLAALHPSLRWIAGHEDLDTTWVASSNDPEVQVARKRDPGPMFPWDRVMAAIPLQRLRP
ncbi:MAG TPA: N-acetylmuramoyl-L-alanine amidase [Lysobacter sp.]|nr:N-acetylmuramoyl-L-alanine amidase [Lysobacter sp.]